MTYKPRKRLPDGPRRKIDIERFKFPPQPHYTLHDACCDYSREHLLKKGKDHTRAWNSFITFMMVIEPWIDVTTLGDEHAERFTDSRLAEGKSAGTVCRDLAMVSAAIHHAHRRNRIKLVPYLARPEYDYQHRRPLHESEFRFVMEQTMSERLRRFYWTAYHTGHRSAAIEELDWSRVQYVDFVVEKHGIVAKPRAIDFNVPGRRTTNKRRCADFPISDEFLESLIEWKRNPLDASRLVIGEGASTYTEAHHIVREVCGLDDPTLVPRHCMRKMYATQMIVAGADIEALAHMTGDRADMLRKHYITHPPEQLAAVATLRTARPTV